MIQLSPAAVNEVLRLKSRRNNPNLLFRLGVQRHGCLEMSYSLTFDETVQVGDQVFSCADLQVVVDAASLTYLGGLLIDYSEDLMGGGFRFHNPQAAQNCGCGNSFSTKSSA